MDIVTWLTELGLEKYAPEFTENEIDLDVVADLGEDDLRELGLPMGPRKKFLRAAKALNTPAERRVAPPTQNFDSSEAERRELTVMFVDLVGSTELSQRLDPEDLRAVVRAYQALCSRSIERYEGFVARYFGDGIMVYFGYPQAHENEPERAVRTALSILETLPELNRKLLEDGLVEVEIRIGIATGLVVAGDLIGEGASEEKAVVGQTPNLAARLQGLAQPNEVVVAPATQTPIDGLFHFTPLGAQHLKGFADAIVPYRVNGATGLRRSFDISARRGLSALVGREIEIDLLMRRWQQAKDGEGQVVLLSGEAGIGKSRIVYALRERLEGQRYRRIRYQGSPFHQSSALFPVADELVRASRIESTDSPEQKREKLDAILLNVEPGFEAERGLLMRLLDINDGDPGMDPATHIDPALIREETLSLITRFLARTAEQIPLLIHLEDAHWIDPSTVELFHRIIEMCQFHRMLVVVSFRPHFVPPWESYSHLSQLTLNRLSRNDTQRLIQSLSQSEPLPEWMFNQILEKTDGIPLFVEELTKAVLNTRQTGAGDEPGSVHIPSTVRDSLLARLDQLAPSREVAQVAAVIGREFSFSLLYQVAELRENDLHQALDSLEEAELLFRRGDGALATYRFKHALLLEATYSTLLHSRRIHLHRRIAEALETADGESTPAPPSVVAHHWTEAGEASRAIPAWRDAGQRSLSQSATEEAAAALRRGLELVPAAAQSEQAEFELELQTLNGWALIATEGYSAPQTQEAFNRALELCRASEDKSQLFAILHGCWANALLAARIDEAFALARELLEVAEGQHHSSHLVVANRVFGTTSFWRGDFQPAREHLDHALSQYNELEHTQIGVISMFDTRIIGLDFLSLTLLPLGQVQAARQNRQLAHAEARESRQHVTLAIILQHTCLFHLLAREPASVGTNARELVTLANDQNFPFWVAHGEFFLAWSEAVAHPSTASVNTLEAALSAVKATGSALFVPYYTALVSEQRLRVSPDQGQISTLQTCIAQLDETGERWCESELYRYLGEQELHAKLPQCIDSLERSLAIATSAGAHTLALRSSISLARACAHFEKAGEGKQLLVKSLSKLDGADITDVSDAQALLATPPFA